MKTKLFTGYFVEIEYSQRKYVDIDVEMNEFLEQNKVEIIDIKLSTSPDADGEIWSTALMLYKEESQ